MTVVRTEEDGQHADLEGLALEVRRRLTSELPDYLHYHDAAHTLDEVVPVALMLADAEGLGRRERELLFAAALLHDIGYIRTTQDHEAASAAMAAEILPRFGFGAAQVAAVERLILATRVGHRPETLSEAIIADADLDVLGRADFWHRNRSLQRELAAIGLDHEDRTWIEIQQRFLHGHTFHTPSARARGGAGKMANERRVATRLRRLVRVAAARAEREGRSA
jgi:predicted metal-dependent HD superfamily phosphohydrolase